MKIPYIIGHAQITELQRSELFEIVRGIKNIKNRNYLTKELNESKSNDFIVAKGNTFIAGYLWVLQILTKKYPSLDVLVVSGNMSIFSV